MECIYDYSIDGIEKFEVTQNTDGTYILLLFNGSDIKQLGSKKAGVQPTWNFDEALFLIENKNWFARVEKNGREYDISTQIGNSTWKCITLK